MPETLRQRVERTYRYEMTSHPVARLLAYPEGIEQVRPLSAEDQLQLAWKMAEALRIALFDLAEQLDVLLGGQVEP